jgi:hypothetical protein
MPIRCKQQTYGKQRGNMSENEVVANQKTILGHQATILENQKTLLQNQAAILKNQGTLNEILANQKTILANQKTILAHQNEVAVAPRSRAELEKLTPLRRIEIANKRRSRFQALAIHQKMGVCIHPKIEDMLSSIVYSARR